MTEEQGEKMLQTLVELLASVRRAESAGETARRDMLQRIEEMALLLRGIDRQLRENA